MSECTNPATDAEAVAPLHSDALGHANILASYVALLCLDKRGFEAINGFREDIYFAEALDLNRAPSEGLLRQRMDRFAPDYPSVVETAAIDFLIQSQAQLTSLDNG